MVTAQNEIQLQNGVYIGATTFYGRSTDSKPTTGVANGSIFMEMDTGKIWFYDAAGAQWLEWGSGT